MGKVTIDEAHLNDIASAIIARGGAKGPLAPGQMANAVRKGIPDYSNLDAVVLTGNITTITEYSVPQGVPVGTATFPYCTAVDTGGMACFMCDGPISLPLCTSVGDNAFSYCSIYDLLYLPVCESVGMGAFQGGILSDVRLPECTYVGDSAFESSVIYSDGIYLPKCTDIGYMNAFRSCNVDNVSLPSVTYIPECSFDAASVGRFLPFDACQDVGAYAFQYCNCYEDLSLPQCTYVGMNAFEGSTFAEVSLPSLPYDGLGSSMFRDCLYLTEVDLSSCEVPGTTPEEIEGNARNICSSGIELTSYGCTVHFQNCDITIE